MLATFATRLGALLRLLALLHTLLLHTLLLLRVWRIIGIMIIAVNSAAHAVLLAVYLLPLLRGKATAVSLPVGMHFIVHVSFAVFNMSGLISIHPA